MRSPFVSALFNFPVFTVISVIGFSCVKPDEVIGPGDGKDTLKITLTNKTRDTIRFYSWKKIGENGVSYDSLTQSPPRIKSLDSLVDYPQWGRSVIRNLPIGWPCGGGGVGNNTRVGNLWIRFLLIIHWYKIR